MGQEFNAESYPKARKTHRCIHCSDLIEVGEKHMKYVGIWSGEFQNWRVHLDCQDPLEACQGEDGSLCFDTHFRGESCSDSYKREQRENDIAEGTSPTRSDLGDGCSRAQGV